MRAPWIAVAIAACSAPDPPGALSLTVCGAPACSVPADGQTTIPVAVCVPGDAPLPPALAVTLALSRGAWEHPSDPTLPGVVTAPLGGIVRCAQASAVAPTDLAPLFIDAAVSGSTARACVQMTAPPLERLLLSSSPPTLAFQQPTALIVSATPLGPAGGHVAAATEVTFAVPVIAPPAAAYALQPQPATVPIGAAGTAMASVVTAPGTTSVTIRAEATVPPGPPCPVDAGVPGAGAGAATVSTTLTVPLLPPPPDAGVADAP